jgi:hypothetical protein
MLLWAGVRFLAIWEGFLLRTGFAFLIIIQLKQSDIAGCKGRSIISD